MAASKVIYGLRREVRDAMKLGQYQLEAKLGEGGMGTPPEPPSARVGRPVVVELERLVLRCLAKSPAERPASAAELEALLAACPDPEPWTPEQSRTWWLELEGLGGRSESAERVEGSALTVDLRRHFAAER